MTDLLWYAVRSYPRREDRARLGIEGLKDVAAAYLPQEKVVRTIRSRRVDCIRPLLPSHLFFAARPDANPFRAVREVDGVQSILAAGRDGPPQVVPYRSIAIIQTVEGELLDEFERKARKRAKIHGDDTSEFIEAIKAAAPQERVDLILSQLGRGKTARLRLEDLKASCYEGYRTTG